MEFLIRPGPNNSDSSYATEYGGRAVEYSLGEMPCASDFQSVVLRPAESASPRGLLEMLILRTLWQPVKLESMQVGPGICCDKDSRLLKFEKYCLSHHLVRSL